MNKSYIIITPAYNEQNYIEKTIKSVLAQSVLPKTWFIVDDGSTDQTAEIIKAYAEQYSWIKYIHRRKDKNQSYYASNVYAIGEGLKTAKGQEDDYLAILDADISLPQDYYEQLLKRMEADCGLGIASGVYVDNVNGTLRKILNDRRSTPKAMMVFRKQCYEEMGGLLPMKYGGEDTCACFMARMHGWKTWSFADIIAIHNKPVGTGHAKSILKIRFRQGIGEYFLATHPLFMLLKSTRRCIKEPPYLIGGIARMAGFVYAHFMGLKRQIPDDLIRYIRAEQFYRVFRGNKIPTKFQVGTSL
jgi:glycosyltransferase involved in cell wall biosynthesis